MSAKELERLEELICKSYREDIQRDMPNFSPEKAINNMKP